MRDVLIVVGVILLRSLVPGYRIAPNMVGKLCTFLQLVLGGTALASLELVPATATFVPPLIGLTAFVTVLSGAIYLVLAVRLTARPAAGGTS
jgi:phosphatidylglycerophosphate synthase